MSGHKGHSEPLAVSNPNHHWMEICISFGSKCSPRPGDGVTSCQDAAGSADTESSQALSAGEKASINIKNWWYSNLFESALCGVGEAVMESTITSDSETKLNRVKLL